MYSSLSWDFKVSTSGLVRYLLWASRTPARRGVNALSTSFKNREMHCSIGHFSIPSEMAMMPPALDGQVSLQKILISFFR